MGGETEERPSGWTVDTLRDYMQRQLDDLRRSLNERYETQSHANQELKDSYTERFANVNEFRGQLNDQVRTFMSRTEVEQMMKSITGVTDCCRPNCQGDGCPTPASAVSAPAKTATIATANAVNRLNTSIVGVAPSTR